MTVYPREPQPGEKISATLVRDIVRCLRRITPMPGKNTRTRVTPNGTFISADGSTTVAASSGSAAGCWSLKHTDADPTVPGHEEETLVLDNQYYQVGGDLRSGEDDTNLLGFVRQGELPEGEEYSEGDKPFVFFKVATDDTVGSLGDLAVDAKKEWAEVVEAAANEHVYVKPLYKLTHDGGVALDMRNMPVLAMYEFQSGN